LAVLDFPNSPSNNDIYEGYIYDATLGVWNKLPGKAQVFSNTTPPPNPINGDLWFNTLDAQFYIYYQDGDSDQWVQLAGAEGPAGPTGPTGAAGPDLFEQLSPSAGDILEYDGSDWVPGQRATTGKAIAMSLVFG